MPNAYTVISLLCVVLECVISLQYSPDYLLCWYILYLLQPSIANGVSMYNVLIHQMYINCDAKL